MVQLNHVRMQLAYVGCLSV